MKKIILSTFIIFSLGILSACSGHKSGDVGIPEGEDVLKKDEGKKEEKKEDVVVNPVDKPLDGDEGDGAGNPPPPPVDPEVLAIKVNMDAMEADFTITQITNYRYNRDGTLREEVIYREANGSIDSFFLSNYDGAGRPKSRRRFDNNGFAGGIKWQQIWEYEQDGRLKATRTDSNGNGNYNTSEIHVYNEDGSQSVAGNYDGNDDGDLLDEGPANAPIDFRSDDEYNSSSQLVLSTHYNGRRLYLESHREYNDAQGRITRLCQDSEPIANPAECDYEETWGYQTFGDRIRGITKITRWRIVRGGDESKITTEVFDVNERLTMRELRQSSQGIVTVSRERFIYDADGRLSEKNVDRNNDRVIDYIETTSYDEQGRIVLIQYDFNGDRKTERSESYEYQPLSRHISDRADR